MLCHPSVSPSSPFLCFSLSLSRQFIETNYQGIGCVDSMCCYSEGENGCARLGRMVAQVMGCCDPAYANRCDPTLCSLCCCRRISYKLEQDEPTAPQE